WSDLICCCCGWHFSLNQVLARLFYRRGNDKCCEFYAFGLGYIEAITFAIDHISNDTNLLPNVTLGFDIRDYCDTPVLAM
ncbi:unnamed protein product, partial [Pocillopora meandrina]